MGIDKAHSKDYMGVSYAGMEFVEANPSHYIIDECIPACKILWSKNIDTFMCSDYLNDGAWIEIIRAELSAQNEGALEKLKTLTKPLYAYHKGTINMEVEGFGDAARDRLVEVANMFHMQDVPHKKAYLTAEEFLVECGCYKIEANFEYEFMEDPMMASMAGTVEFETPADLFEAIKKYEVWENSSKSKETFKMFDDSKVLKPIEEYVRDANMGDLYIPEEGRIYNSKYYYDKHLRYLEYVDKIDSDTNKKDSVPF